MAGPGTVIWRESHAGMEKERRPYPYRHTCHGEGEEPACPKGGSSLSFRVLRLSKNTPPIALTSYLNHGAHSTGRAGSLSSPANVARRDFYRKMKRADVPPRAVEVPPFWGNRPSQRGRVPAEGGVFRPSRRTVPPKGGNFRSRGQMVPPFGGTVPPSVGKAPPVRGRLAPRGGPSPQTGGPFRSRGEPSRTVRISFRDAIDSLPFITENDAHSL